MKSNGTQKGFVLGEAVRNRVTGQKMFVDANWSPEVTCVYFDPSKNSLVKVEVSPEDLETVEELLSRPV
ncbi:hypothetical protein LEP1GSC021_4560 [Leptospira noguchii str. 1993005606]|uniref:hypothetical protein n=1 Tax=Leptospira noguchii TaxID=28182 RepID=UPI0003147358|nr:hypothetical protein [Leptospira noguchii]EPE82857.1 hypothetical protein LEP1GSC021_4546 [Leptospira noguchii str. 1993005606]EPE84478.1 hypothetical protein LEP1GSC021_4560 [Leptospira noguchii str. 1993005606]